MSKKVAILGTGIVGATLAKGFAARGDQVVFGTRDPQGAKAQEALAAVPGAKAAGFADAAAGADLAVVALP
jgi:predicted dinucleotide-binding enzyme